VAAVVVVVAAGIAIAVARGSGSASPGTDPVAAPSSVATGPPATATAAPGVSAATAPAAPPGSLAPGATLRPVEGPAVLARALAAPPVIDGKGDDWPALSPVIADQLVVGNTATVKGVWSLGWDTDNLYLLVDVVDPESTRSNVDRPSQLFKGDGVTVQFGAPQAPVDGISLTPGDVSLTLAPTADGRAVAAITLASGSRFDVDAGRTITGVTAAATTTPTGYTLEAKVRWSVIQQPDAPGLLTTKFEGAQFALNLLVEDADPSAASTTGIRSRVSNSRYVADHTTSDGSYRRYWGSLTLQG
ncbi:MAG: sugar-binding protein, partial [Lapillicoccus sp.]